MLAILIIILLLVIVGILFLLKNNDEYDERQKAVMDHGSRYALIVVLILNLIFYTFSVFEGIPKLSVMLTSVISIWSGVLISSLYAIWNHAYFSIKAKKVNGFAVVMLITGIPSLVFGVVDLLGFWGERTSIVKDASFLIFGISCFSIAATIMLRNHLDRREDEGR